MMNTTRVKIWVSKLIAVCLLASPTALLMSFGKPRAQSRLVELEQSGIPQTVRMFMRDHGLSRNDMGLLMNAYQYKFPTSYISQVGTIAIMLVLYKAISLGLCKVMIREKKAQQVAALGRT